MTTAKQQKAECDQLVEQLQILIAKTNAAQKALNVAKDAETAFRRKLDAAHREYHWLLNSERNKA